MPIYIELANLIVPKSIVKSKYKGGVEKFIIDYSINGDNRHQEDGLLFSISKMNCDEYHIEELIVKGLDYNIESNTSNDFTIISRYEGCLWKVNWLEFNYMFAWHVNTQEDQINFAKKRNDLTMDKISELFELGLNPFNTI